MRGNGRVWLEGPADSPLENIRLSTIDWSDSGASSGESRIQAFGGAPASSSIRTAPPMSGSPPRSSQSTCAASASRAGPSPAPGADRPLLSEV